MSFFKSLGRIFKPLENITKPFIKPFVATLPGGPAILAASQVFNSGRAEMARGAAANSGMAGSVFLPSQGRYASYSPSIQPRTQPMSLFPTLLGAGRAVMPGVGAAAGAVGRVARRYGGVATAGAILYDAAGNPVQTRKRPRSKGITARELKSFTRVTGILNKYCKTPAPTKRRNAPRGKSCR